jgi:hypothetical protein
MSANGELVLGACEGKAGVRTVVAESGSPRFYRITCDDRHPLPTIILKAGNEKWNLEPYIYLAVDVHNLGTEEILVECRPNEVGAITVGGGQWVGPGETRTVRTYLIRDQYPRYLDEKLYGMFALPAHPSIVKTWKGVHPGSIDRVSLVLIHPPKNTVVRVGNVRGDGAFAFLSEEELAQGYFPFVDQFGQYRHRDWPGKTHSVAQLQQARADEAREIAAHPAPEPWDTYGGWLGGPKLQATGHFRTQKVSGKWWLVDPEGRLFWSHGLCMSVIGDGHGTPITEREHYFADLPDPAQYPELYGTHDWIPVGHYKDRAVRIFNHFGWNLLRKYGADWKKDSFRQVTTRLKSWAMNSCFGWSAATIRGLQGIPYAAMIGTRGARRIEGSAGYWGKFPDPFDPSFGAVLQAGMEALSQTAADPYCLGYCVDNEMDWGDAAYLAGAVIQSDRQQPAKAAALRLLQDKYGTVEKWNAAWHTTFGSWDGFLENTAMPAGAGADLQGFSAMVAVQYFQAVRDALRQCAPHKLYLGCRFHDHYYPVESSTCDWVVKIAAEYCDVVSFNRYRYSAADLRPSDADKPVLIGEWHMGALDRGMLHYTLRMAQSQAHRAELYEHYLRSCVQNPYIVGAHWFEYVDEPVTGRFDGENFNTGFVDGCDAPYPEMVQAARNMGQGMYDLRFSGR